MPSTKTLTWSTSPERQRYVHGQMQKSAMRAWLAAALIVLGAVGIGLRNEGAVYGPLGIALLVIAIGVLAWAIAPYVMARRAYLERNQADKAVAVESALGDLVGATGQDSLPLTKLYVFNRRQLDEYQTLTKRHAAMAFRNAQLAAACGFTLVLLGVIIVLVLGNDEKSTQITVGGLAGLGTLISTFIGRTFFRSYKDAMAQLGIYYEEPFLTSRALSAERVITKWQQLRTEGSDASITALVLQLLDPRRGPDGLPGGPPRTETETQAGDEAEETQGSNGDPKITVK